MLQRILRPTLLAAAGRRVLSPLWPAVAAPFSTSTAVPDLAPAPATTTSTATTTATPPPPSASPPSSKAETLRLLPLLRAQPQHYITIHIHSFPFLVTLGDTITLPFRLKNIIPGQTLRLTHASILGSRDYTLKGSPWIDEKLFSCRAAVVEETREPMRVKKKTKRRQRKIKTVKSKHPYTVLRIKELEVLGGEEEA
ncbi:ribosomal protein L21-like protein [Tricharina praecox]|uniref:ribosomal protein L21-like protein n=1 Tax=Tricharina praecox TaxID=43433 RepID=UPI00221EB019|nr:ribosomal protein L21-like protein [Tricharina praecox]KAI5857693.1 ribosomal protein L21-like protein [Tricharina praecox]